MEALYRQRGDVRGQPGPHTIGWRALGVTCATRWCGGPWPPSGSPLDFVSCQEK
jgi:hypothetical protein